MNSTDRIILDRNELKTILDAEKAAGKKVVFTNGCFDILHRGHVDYMERAKAYGDILVVAINTDESVKRLDKGTSRPLNPLKERALHMAALRSVDYVTQFDEDTPKEIVELLIPNVMTKGGDYTIDTMVGSDTVLANGGEAYCIPFVDGYSTTNWLEGVYTKLTQEKAEKTENAA